MSPPVSKTDLLIIGAGPAGRLAAAWASRCKLNARIIDDKSTRVTTGRADGLHSRTLEILDSFGIADEILQQCCVIKEISSWESILPNPRKDSEDHIVRTEVCPSLEEDFSRYPQVTLSQGMVEQAFLNFLERDGSIRVERNLTPSKLSIDEAGLLDHATHPIEISLRHADSQDSHDEAKEIVQAKYVLGTDGARSWTRNALGIEMEGDRTNKHFGVMDIVPLTDFPDIRVSCAIHSGKSGSIMTVPRENNIVRFYVQLAETESQGGDFDPRKVTLDVILDATRRILKPYTLEYSHCDWHSTWTVGQRIATKFSHHDRIFLAGDAVHTHSPTMGAGMNVSMQDSYNLVWKIATALRSGNPDILGTYDLERYQTAVELIEGDRKMTKFYSDGPSADSEKYHDFRVSFDEFLSGCAVQYSPSMLVIPMSDNNRNGGLPGLQAKQHLAPGIKIGQRLPSCHMTNHFSADVVHLQKTLKSDGRWRLLVFSGNLLNAQQHDRVRDLGNRLEAPNSFINRVTPHGEPIDSLVEVLTIHSSDRHSVSPLDLPNIFHPWNDEHGWDWKKVYASAVDRTSEDVYEKFGIDKEVGCLVVCRPDQHVGYIGELKDLDAVEDYFGGIFFPRSSLNRL